ncbi:helix-turn-helix domain-containing protein [Oceanobacillus caeni]|uniref:helix-turn-helix domain-containing protein n=1 Tax=Oceanobacillus caeni TaxID=405946 RepID=UPI002149D6B9|nr:helix-turn-helix transcriptional regulator [Oceanobacillus caeni]MCR1833170.1 helix-turn-helix domain-containing protein [Oceanobacillus caeni]
MKYYLNFDGTIGEFIKLHRKKQKISARDLSRELGKGDAYISQIENGRNKNPDYDVVYSIFQKVGIDEDKIEDYLESFNYLSPEREQDLIDKQMHRYEMTAEEFKQYEESEREIRNSNPEYFINTGDGLLKEIINGRLNKINSILKDVSVEKSGEGFNLVKNLENTLNNMQNNKRLYLFIQKLFDNNLSLLDEDSFVRILNTLYDEMNKAEEENASWGKPNIKQKINKL